MKENLTRIHHNLYVSKNDPLYLDKIINYNSDNPYWLYKYGRHKEGEGSLEMAAKYYLQASHYGHKCAEKDYYRIKNSLEVHKSKSRSIAPFIMLGLLSLLILLSFLHFHKFILNEHKYINYKTQEVTYDLIEKNGETTLLLDEVTPGQLEEILRYKGMEENKKAENQRVKAVHKGTGKIIGESYWSQDRKLIIKNYLQPQSKLNNQGATFSKSINPEKLLALNLVRTAAAGYQIINGRELENLDDLVGPYPLNYLSLLPPVEFRLYPQAISLEKRIRLPDYDYSDLNPDNTIERGDFYKPIKLIIDRSKHRLYYLHGDDVIKSFEVGLGKKDSTPLGTYFIKERVVFPEPQSIYGTRGFSLSRDDYGLHGTFNNESIGSDMSQGCIRMFNEDIEELFPNVPLGTVIEIKDMTDYPREVMGQGLPIGPGEISPHNEKNEGKIYDWKE